MVDYEELWYRLKAFADDYLFVSTTRYDNSSDRETSNYFYGRMSAYQRIADLMADMEEAEEARDADI